MCFTSVRAGRAWSNHDNWRGLVIFQLAENLVTTQYKFYLKTHITGTNIIGTTL